MTLPTGPHGGDAERVARLLGCDVDEVLDLSASLNPFAPDAAAVAARHLGSLRRYPDAARSTVALADAIGVDPACLVLTNGGAEAIALVAAELGSGAVVEPEFSLYRRHLREVRAGAGRWRSNPSNPLGALAAPTDRAAVWDEAFWPLATGTWTRGDDTSWRLGSLTKLWACPGLRLGYAIAPDAEAAGRIRAAQPQWAVSALAAALVSPLLDRSDLVGWSTAIARLATAIASELAAMGFTVRATDANWLLVTSSRPLRDDLAGQRVLVRDCGSFGLADTYRIALPRPAERDRLLTAFAAVAGRSSATAPGAANGPRTP